MEYIRSIIFFLVLVVIQLPLANSWGEQIFDVKYLVLNKDPKIEVVKSRPDLLKNELLKPRNLHLKFNKPRALEINTFERELKREEFLHFHVGSIRFHIKTNGEWIR